MKFCLIARGEADLYARLGQTSEWDTAAGQAILAAAGGSVTTLDGRPLLYGKKDAGYANPAFHRLGARAAASRSRHDAGAAIRSQRGGPSGHTFVTLCVEGF